MKVRERKLKRLRGMLEKLGSVVVAYSGGVDSSFLLKIAVEILGDKVLAVTALSETYPKHEVGCARNLARELGARLKVIRTHELKNARFRNNPENRCYFCKKELFSKLKGLAKKHHLDFVVDGSNVDDLSDYRPGAQAKKEFGVVSPLQEAGLTKKDIRELSKRAGLATWCKPALACLASRIPYYSKINRPRLMKIERAEEALRKAFKIRGNLRVRDLGDVARIEVDKPEINRLRASERTFVLLRKAGYKDVVVDPKGYRTGSLNEGVRKHVG